MSRRDELNEYRGDVWYEEYRRGLPENTLSDERIDDGFYDDVSPESLVQGEQNRRQEQRQDEQNEQDRQQYEQWEQKRQEHGLGPEDLER